MAFTTPYIPLVRPPRQPYALDTPLFSFASLAALAGRSTLGGPREIVLATYATARMAEDLAGGLLSAEARNARATSARRWLSTLAINENSRRAFQDLIGATETDVGATATALRRVMDVTNAILDAASRADLERLARELEAQAVGRT